ncbi:hypothetical protein C8R43DRAFT_23351 [Mycena crocata]|nr:hypothetical protein C8R43DRAFT_23351 [Mycena crocata]
MRDMARRLKKDGELSKDGVARRRTASKDARICAIRAIQCTVSSIFSSSFLSFLFPSFLADTGLSAHPSMTPHTTLKIRRNWGRSTSPPCNQQSACSFREATSCHSSLTTIKLRARFEPAYPGRVSSRFVCDCFYSTIPTELDQPVATLATSVASHQQSGTVLEFDARAVHDCEFPFVSRAVCAAASHLMCRPCCRPS